MEQNQKIEIARWRNEQIQHHASFCSCDVCSFSVDDIFKMVKRGDVVLA